MLTRRCLAALDNGNARYAWRRRSLSAAEATSVPLELAQAEYFQATSFQPLAAAVIRQIDHEAAFHHDSAHLLDQLRSRFGSAAGGDQVVQQQHAVARADRIDVDFDPIATVFELVVVPDRLGRELAFFADRNEPHAQGEGDRRSDDEAARLDSRDLVDFLAAVVVRDLLDRHAEPDRVLQQGRDIAKHDPRPRVVRHGPDVRLDIHVQARTSPLTRPYTSENRSMSSSPT